MLPSGWAAQKLPKGDRASDYVWHPVPRIPVLACCWLWPWSVAVWRLVENQRLGHELYPCLLKETGGSEEAMEQPVTWGWWMQVLMGGLTQFLLPSHLPLGISSGNYPGVF